MALYWATSAFYGLGQNLLLKSPTARSSLRVPSAPSDSKTPFRDMGDVIRRRYFGRKEIGEKEDLEGKREENKSGTIRGGKRNHRNSRRNRV